MPVPTYDRFIHPLLVTLARSPEPLTALAASSAVADALQLTAPDRAQLLPSGDQPVYRNRIGWAHDRLKRAALSHSPKRGVWQLTPEGRAYAARFPDALPEPEIARLAFVDREARAVATSSAHALKLAAQPAAPVAQSPDERIEGALGEIRDRVRRSLLEEIARASPTFFETLVLDLLHAMGYGASRADIQHVGGPGDGGIDGVISLDRLGLEKVYVQAKRWQNPVGSPQVQTFLGALQVQSARKGVLITTSTFTRDAVDTAARSRGTVVLMDGERLTALMLEHGVGVTRRTLAVPRVDTEYFGDE